MADKSVPSRIRRIAVVDDDRNSREAMAESVNIAKFTPVLEFSELGSLRKFVEEVRGRADAAICDHRLRPKNYAGFYGAEVVSALYSMQIPALLVTAYSSEDLDIIRPYRRGIPVIVEWGGLDPNVIREGIVTCLREFRNTYVKERQPWRVLVRVDSVDRSSVNVIVPSWDPKTPLGLPVDMFTKLNVPLVPGTRFFAKVNIGAMGHEDLYFDDFEPAQSPGGRYAGLARS